MKGGFKRLVNPPSKISEVNLEATRQARAKVHEEVRLRQRLAHILAMSRPGDGSVTAESMSADESDFTGDGPWGGEAA